MVFGNPGLPGQFHSYCDATHMIAAPKPEEEYVQIVKALKLWFISQDLMPADACVAMTMLIAEQMVEHTQDVTELQQAININKEYLTVEVEGCRRRKK